MTELQLMFYGGLVGKHQTTQTFWIKAVSCVSVDCLAVLCFKVAAYAVLILSFALCECWVEVEGSLLGTPAGALRRDTVTRDKTGNKYRAGLERT